MKQSYDSLSFGVQSVRTDVEGISQYLLKDQQQRRNLLEQRKLKKARETDVKEKSDIMSALKKALGSTKDQEMFGNIMSQQDYAAIKNPPGGGAAGGGGGLGGGALAAAGVGVAAGALGTMMGGDSASPGSSGSGGSANLSPTQKQALDILSKYESASAGGYNAVNQIGVKGGRGVLGYSGDFRKMKQHAGKALTDMTIAEIMSLQAKRSGMSNEEWISQGRLHAVGRYQFIGGTLPGVVKRAGIPTTAKFTPEVQDLLAMQYLKEAGIGAWIGPSDKATKEERAIIEKARKEPISYKPSISSGTPQTAAKPAGAGTPQAASGAAQAAGTPQASAGAPPSYLPDPSKSLGANLRDLTSSAGTPGTAQQSMMPPASGVDQKVSQTASQISSAQPQMKQMDPSSIVPFDTQQVASGGYSQAPQNQGQQSNITSTPDFPEAIPTSNPLTKMWTLSAINHLNINGSMDHIYG